MMPQRGSAERRVAGNIALLMSLLAALVAAPYFLHPERSSTMTTLATSTGFLAEVPPIDTSVPGKIETATFSLG